MKLYFTCLCVGIRYGVYLPSSEDWRISTEDSRCNKCVSPHQTETKQQVNTFPLVGIWDIFYHGQQEMKYFIKFIINFWFNYGGITWTKESKICSLCCIKCKFFPERRWIMLIYLLFTGVLLLMFCQGFRKPCFCQYKCITSPSLGSNPAEGWFTVQHFKQFCGNVYFLNTLLSKKMTLLLFPQTFDCKTKMVNSFGNAVSGRSLEKNIWEHCSATVVWTAFHNCFIFILCQSF